MADEQSRQPRIEQGSKRVRGYARGELIFDTTRPVLVWEIPYFPTYYVAREEVIAELVASGDTKISPSSGEGELLDIKLNRDTVPNGAVRYSESPIEDLRDLVRFDWDALDEWLEEDEPVYTHPRDPYTRIDILNSSRHIEIVVDGVKVAETHKPTILYETGLPPRFYMPLTDVDTELLTPTDAHTYCPYKGTSGYFSLTIGDNVHKDFV